MAPASNAAVSASDLDRLSIFPLAALGRHAAGLGVAGVVGGIVGALGTGILSAASLGGIKGGDFSIGVQFLIQLQAVAITLVWSGVVSAVLYKLLDLTIGLRPALDDETQGLDLTTHGEQAYHG